MMRATGFFQSRILPKSPSPRMPLWIRTIPSPPPGAPPLPGPSHSGKFGPGIDAQRSSFTSVARVVGIRVEDLDLPGSRQCRAEADERVVGRDQHGRHAYPIERVAPRHHDPACIARAVQPTRVLHVQDVGVGVQPAPSTA